LKGQCDEVPATRKEKNWHSHNLYIDLQCVTLRAAHYKTLPLSARIVLFTHVFMVINAHDFFVRMLPVNWR